MKQSKSLGNYVNAQDEITKYGSDILRLWVSSVNYQEDVRCTDELIGRTQDAYRKIRNTLRYLFGNIDDFDPTKHAVSYEQMIKIDKWALQQLQELIVKVKAAYDDFAFHQVFSLLYNFCTIEMSSIYMDVLKDRMYCDATDGPRRRSAQAAMHEILGTLVRLLAPILVHTAEEAWQTMTFRPENCDSVHLATMPVADNNMLIREPEWDTLLLLRDQVLWTLEGLRRDKVIASNQEASITVHCTPQDAAILKWLGIKEFAALCIVSEVKLEEGAAQTTITAAKSPYPKCQRCWNYWPSVGTDPEYPDICERCTSVVRRR
jgi:isoleucyl-tRNA synthetase